ncbi:unnamed protein product [Ectocarpus sp. 12 AP-2014]
MFQLAERSTGQAHEIQGERAKKWWGRCGRSSGRGIRQRPSSVPVFAGLFTDNALGGRYRALRRRRRRDTAPAISSAPMDTQAQAAACRVDPGSEGEVRRHPPVPLATSTLGSTRNPRRGSDDRAELVADTKEVTALWRKAAEQEVRGDEPAFGDIEKGRAKDLAMEGFIDDVQRLQAKVDSASSNFLREKYRKLLDAAEARVARAEQSSDEVAMASSSAAAAPPPSSSPAAPSSPAAVEGGTVAGHVI